jgi:thiol-disulfide isomerase/thioredoxin
MKKSSTAFSAVLAFAGIAALAASFVRHTNEETATVATATAVQAPKVSIADSKDLPTPLPFPYDEEANATQQVEEVLARARASGKRVVIDFGGNWCPDCRILSGTLELPEVKPFVEEHFEMVAIDVGRFDRNLHIPQRFNAKVNGVPWLVIAEPDGTVIHSSYEVTDNGLAHKPQGMVDWLAKWAKPVAQ